jgi:SWI/SNF related-matrix-associated actin-dependent regulator of chromatin subfamily C
MIEMSKKLDSRYLTSTMARRSIPGDAGSILRLHEFLTSYALINETSINDTTPTPMVFVRKSCPSGNEELHLKIREAVVDQARNKRANMSESDEAPITIDWGIVARTVGGGLSATDCQRQFLAMPLMDDEKEPDASKGKRKRQEEIFQNRVESTDPAVLQKVLTVALESTEDVIESQKAAVLGTVANQTVQDAQIQHQSVSRILSEIVDLRMQKLENRLAVLDDVEGLLDAERVALELERRDLYTARCRHWFGGT